MEGCFRVDRRDQNAVDLRKEYAALQDENAALRTQVKQLKEQLLQYQNFSQHHLPPPDIPTIILRQHDLEEQLPHDEQPSTQHQQQLPSAPSSKAVAIQRQASKTQETQILPNTPVSEKPDGSQKAQSKPQKKKKRLWEPSARGFINTVPSSAKYWYQKAKKTELCTLDQITVAFRIITLRQTYIRLPSPSLPLEATSQNTLEATHTTLEAYINLQHALGEKKEFSKQIYYYGRLLMFSMCRVACVDMSAGEADIFIKKCFQTSNTRSGKYLKSQCAAARWAAQLIETLEATFGERASLLFLLCKSTMHHSGR